MFYVPEVIKNLVIINALMFLASALYYPFLHNYLALYPFSSEMFQPYQIVTHMFMHGDLGHLFFNMLGLFMFGGDTEIRLGPKKFLSLYLITGLGAMLLHQLARYIELHYALGLLSDENAAKVLNEGIKIYMQGQNYADPYLGYANSVLNQPMLGASGAVFGILAAFAMLYPNKIILLIIPPIPIKAKYLALILAGLEIYRAVLQNDNIAHFAHLGGALFGFLMINYWRRQGERF